MVVESRSVIRNVKNARGLPLPPPPFPSRARLIFTLLVLIRSQVYTIGEPDTGIRTVAFQSFFMHLNHYRVLAILPFEPAGQILGELSK